MPSQTFSDRAEGLNDKGNYAIAESFRVNDIESSIKLLQGV